MSALSDLSAGTADAAQAGPSSTSTSSAPRPTNDLQNGTSRAKTETATDDEVALVTADQAHLAEAKKRHEADLKKYQYEPPRAERVQDDWQVAYVWAFVVKFKQMDKIPRLECIDDFERCLLEPVANRPDDVLEGVLVRFLSNLKPGLRNLDCTNIQHHLSNFISDQLHSSTEFTVWDRPWAPHEEARGPCCTDARDRHEMGRLRYPGEPLGERMEKNPIRQMESQGGGLFELSWWERAKLLRQLVDWQLTHSETIRAIINADNNVSTAKQQKMVTVPEGGTKVEPLGMDRSKNRIWQLDSSSRLYKSGNPFKRPCPLTTLATTRTEFEAAQARFASYGAQPSPKLKAGGKNGKPTPQESVAHRKLLKGMEEEKALSEILAGRIADIEKEEARVQRARRKIVQAVSLAQMAEMRSTRTRRPTRKVDYTFAEMDESDEDDRSARKRRREPEPPSRTVIPGERQSSRLAAAAKVESDDDMYAYAGRNGATSRNGRGGRNIDAETSSAAGSAAMEVLPNNDGVGIGVGGKKRMKKGYVVVEEYVPFHELTEGEREGLTRGWNGGGEGDGVGTGIGVEDGGEAEATVVLDDAGVNGSEGKKGLLAVEADVTAESSPLSVAAPGVQGGEGMEIDA